MATSSRAISADVRNLLDYLLRAELVIFSTNVLIQEQRVSWHSYHRDALFLSSRNTATLETYRSWVEAGAYSALVFDGSLLQITYDIAGGEVVGHRLAYIPCPFEVDEDFLKEEPILEVIDMYVSSMPRNIILHSAIRFDFDLEAAKEGHPAAHMTINSHNCRIACCAPMHINRFADFVFRSFYPKHWQAHRRFFESGARSEIGRRTLTDEEARQPHIHWRQ